MRPGFLDSYLPYLLQKADHLLSAHFHVSLQRAGIQVSEWRVLAVLADHGPRSLQELADIALLPQPTASHACRRLENAGLLSRLEDEQDRRRKMLSLTHDGTDVVEGLIAKARHYETEALKGLSLGDADFGANLGNLIAELEAQT